MDRRTVLILGGIFILAYFLRVMFLPQGALTFGYDQARDAFVTGEIIGGDWKILGPPASTPGLYHGVFYYYFLVPAYILSRNPLVAAYWTALFNAGVVLIVYLLAYLMTKRKSAGFVSAFLFAISFESTQYAVWLSNPTLGVWTVPVLYLGLWLWVNEKYKTVGSVLTALGLALSIQSEIFLAYHIIPVMLWLFYQKKKIRMNELMKFMGVFGIGLLTMLLVELKFGFKGIAGAFSLLSTGESVSHGKSLGDFVVLFLNQIGRVYGNNSYPGNVAYGAILVVFLMFYSIYKWNKKGFSWEPFLVVWLMSHLTVVSVGGTSTPFLLVGIGPAVSIILGIWLSHWFKNNKVVVSMVLILLMIGNLSMIQKENARGQTIFAIQKDLLLSNELKAIDYTYSSAHKENFSVNTLTSPLWINTVWSYLYNWYGSEKYGYLPYWHGRDQVGRLGNNFKDIDEHVTKMYLIKEPLQGIPPGFVIETVENEDRISRLVDEVYYGELVVQKRERID